jgi:hypothetical protein
MPSFMSLFHMFWPMLMLMDIVEETNRYATTLDANWKLPGGADWYDISVPKLKAFLSITLKNKLMSKVFG